ncbi:tRNA isopentenyltransferase [Coniochaeta ligniaria NRRL 30616]|uniref:tRNA dimethylallyltransferase n=1 Tax=Coniochaeta ligniaria NRRL 30616 TaxID=1408157 RepID=A0A1J7IRN6_9PEZI|nr:tRNA isopentenyltransferase [Coniochaeta ligniaria NRRL 30616]
MATKSPPAEPLVVIFGSTGTGKSDLAVDLATRFNGEIINSDAMQMYKGLPIITNKISEAERRGIPHHLLGNIGLEEETWVVGVFKREATRLVRDIRSRGKLPIVVGGTHYYINGLLFENTLVEDHATRSDNIPKQAEDGKSAFPILNASTEEVLEKLREVDPVMADRWHPNDRRKIQRSLEIYLTTGRRASDIYEEQRRQTDEAKASSAESQPQTSSQALMLWVYSKPSVLNERLNKRVDKMLDGGLMAEVSEMHEYLQTRSASGHTVDHSKGIWQSIGFKEFEPYLGAASEGGSSADETRQLEDLKQTALERMKTATRQYAKGQVRWITYKTLPLIRQAQALDRLFLLDSTDIDRWREDVSERGVDITRRFLAGEQLPTPTDLSETAREVLASKLEESTKEETRSQKTCDLCKTTTVTEEAWQKHIKGRPHQRAVRHAKRTALVPHPIPTALAVAHQDRPSSPEYSGLDFAVDDEKS